MGEFGALMLKNWILYKRGCCGNCCEIFIPIIFTGFIIMVSLISPPVLVVEQSYLTNTQYSQTVDHISNLNLLKSYCPTNSKIGLVPSTGTIINSLKTLLTTYSKDYITFNSQGELEAYVRSEDYKDTVKVCWAIVIQSQSSNKYQYKLRFNISLSGSNNDGPLTTLPITQDSGMDLENYQAALWNGMIGANHLVNNMIFQKESSGTKYIRQTASPAYQEQFLDNKIYQNLYQSIAIIFLMPLLIIYLRQTSSMLSEKQSKVRESMRIMGMKMRNYYLTWFIRYFIIYCIVHFAGTGIILYKLSYIPFYVPLILFLMFDVVIIIQNFFIQVFLSRARLGIVITLLFFVVQYVASFAVSNNSTPSESYKNMLSIIPHVAFIFAFQNILYFQSKQITASFSASVNNYTLRTAIISFGFNILAYLILLWYLDQVIPSEWGAKRHPLFCFFEKYFARPQSSQSEIIQKKRGVIEQVDNNFKKMQKSNEIIEIAGLRKQFNGGQLLAVDNLNLNIYKNQIFVLLGHNGAGKTTTISMLTGLLDPTQGFISVFGETDMDNIRKSLGFCPQHDTLYQDLTVEEHLNLFATFKGLQGQEKQREVQKLIVDVNLAQKRDEYTKNLSGGQKRRLSVAIAFAGKSKAIILDEPTSGMDTSARRYIWDLLKTYKSDRIIILTTHFMDQADFLGDRIGIMGAGQLLCCGSSIFLKNRFGVGYNITFVKQNSQVESGAIIRTIQKHIPTAVVLSDVSSQLSMQLPLNQIRNFSNLFNQIDSKKAPLRIMEYGISITTLEQVFLRVADQLEQQKNKLVQHKIKPAKSLGKDRLPPLRKSNHEQQSDSLSNIQLQKSSKNRQKQYPNQLPQIPRYRGSCTRFSTHFRATFIKRFRVIKRDVKTFLFQLVLPLGVIVCALLLMKISYVNDLPAQYINLGTYLSEQNPVVVPLGSSNSALLTSLNTVLNTQYSSLVSLKSDSTYTTAATFDQNYLSPLKKAQSTLKGGLFFLPSAVEGSNTVYPFYSLCITRSPTSYFFLPNLATQALVNSQFGKNIQITMANHPLPLTFDQLSVGAAISGFLGAFVFTLAIAFKFASIISFIVKERQDRVKHQQIVSGMMISAYWFANFIYDYFLYLCIALPAVVLCKLFSISSLSSDSAYLSTWLIFIAYGLAYIPLTYIIAFLYKDYGSAQSYYFFLTFLIGGMLPVLTFVLRIISKASNQIGRYISWGLRIFPSYAFGEGVINLGSIQVFKSVEGNGLTPMSLEISLAPILFLFGQFILYLCLLFMIEAVHNNQSLMRCCSRQDSILDTEYINQSDVINQYKKAMKAKPKDYQILTKNLRKVFIVDGKKKYKVAVDNMAVGIKKGEVFGLLGVNGAGKSTTFKMLSGQITSTSGDSYFCGLKISENLDKIRQSLGYCPQFDALVETLTVRQQIQLYYDMKSLDSQLKESLVTQKINELDLHQYQNKASGTLSGGNKRKLSVAIAMIGNPKIIFLDEPSTGMDPKARRFMWKVISKIATQQKQSTIILTTHSMQQAQALSTRLAIMVKGNFQCIGTPQHIKSKYGQGMEIQIKLIPIERKRIEEVIQKKKLKKHSMVTPRGLNEILNILNASPQDRAEISQYGKGSHIYQLITKDKKVEIELIIQYLQISFILRSLCEDIHKVFGQVEILQILQTFLRLKIKRKPNIGKLFDFFQSNKGHYGIQQYNVKQASVQQIFNKFAQNGAQSSNKG